MSGNAEDLEEFFNFISCRNCHCCLSNLGYQRQESESVRLRLENLF